MSLTFVPVFRPRDRFGQFRAEGVAKGSYDLWLSIVVPSAFPVGKFHAHITLSVKGRVEVITHFHDKAIVILFNPWNRGKINYYMSLCMCKCYHSSTVTAYCVAEDDDTYLKDEIQKQEYLLDDVGTIWRGTESHKTPLYWEYGQVCA